MKSKETVISEKDRRTYVEAVEIDLSLSTIEYIRRQEHPE